MAQKQNLNVKAGDLICFSSGEYSDYSYEGHFVALQDISADLINKIVLDVNNEGHSYNKHEKFISRLIKDGYLLSINFMEIHLGSYGELDVS